MTAFALERSSDLGVGGARWVADAIANATVVPGVMQSSTPQDVNVHRQLADLALRLREPVVLHRRRPGLQPLTATREELFTPGGDPARWLPRLPRQRIETLHAEYAEDQLRLARALQGTSLLTSGKKAPPVSRR